MTEWAELARTRQGLFRYMSGALSVPSTEHFEALSNAYAFLDERGLDGLDAAGPF